MRKFILYFMVSIAWWTSSCEDPNKNEEFKVYTGQPIATWLDSRPEYSDWVKLLQKVNLYNALNLITEYTCFVADNDALAAYLKTHTAYVSVDEMSFEDADFLIRYHIIPGKTLTSSNLLLKIPVPTASGFYLTAGIEPETGIRYIDNGEGRGRSVLIERDIRLLNGVVHKLDSLLQPITESVWDLVAGNPSYSIFGQSLKECGLEKWLDARENKIGEDAYVDEKTLLVVSDEIFRENGIDDLGALKALYPGEGTDTTSDFYRYVMYHILNSSSGFAELTNFPEGKKAMNIYPCAPLTAISVVDSVNRIWLNPHTGHPVNIIDSRRDIPANNGYVHEINGLMPIPEFIARHVVVWETTDSPEFRIIPFYRSEKSTGDLAETFEIKAGSVQGIRWESIPSSAAKVYYQSQNIDNGRFLYNDALVADLGKSGWIELSLPVLPRGKYNIYGVKSTSAGGGKFTVWIDNQTTALANGAIRDFGGGAAQPLFGDYNFTREETHTVRFKMVEPGFWMLDRLIFVPVE